MFKDFNTYRYRGHLRLSHPRVKAGSSTSYQTETNNLMTRHDEVDRNVFDFNATVDDHGLDDGMDDWE